MGKSQKVCKIKIIKSAVSKLGCDFTKAIFLKIKLMIIIKNNHSNLFKMPKTSFPILSPTGKVTPSAWNLTQDSIKLIESKKPIQMKVMARAIGYFTFIIVYKLSVTVFYFINVITFVNDVLLPVRSYVF